MAAPIPLTLANVQPLEHQYAHAQTHIAAGAGATITDQPTPPISLQSAVQNILKGLIASHPTVDLSQVIEAFNNFAGYSALYRANEALRDENRVGYPSEREVPNLIEHKDRFLTLHQSELDKQINSRAHQYGIQGPSQPEPKLKRPLLTFFKKPPERLGPSQPEPKAGFLTKQSHKITLWKNRQTAISKINAKESQIKQDFGPLDTALLNIMRQPEKPLERTELQDLRNFFTQNPAFMVLLPNTFDNLVKLYKNTANQSSSSSQASPIERTCAAMYCLSLPTSHGN